jgi:hypothetical protein
MASIWDKFKNATPFDELANAGMAAARGIGNVAGQGAYGLGRAAGTGVNLYGQALGRMAGMGMDAAQGLGHYGMQGAQALGHYGMQGAQALGNAELDNLRRQMDMARTIGSGVGGAAMGAGRGFMEGVRGPEAGMGKSMGSGIINENWGNPQAVPARSGAGRMLGIDVADAIRKIQTRNQQMPMPVVRNSYGAPGRYGG